MANLLLTEELREANAEKIAIKEELNLQQNSFAESMNRYLGNDIKNNLNKRPILTKEEKKYIKKTNQQGFWNKMKKMFLGENDTTFE